MAHPKSFWKYRGLLVLLPLLLIFTAAEINTAPLPTVYKTLTVTKSGYGSGTVTSNPAGISCGSDCTQTYSSTTDVTLTATAAAPIGEFLGWYVRRSDGGSSGEYTGLGTCTATNASGDCTASTYTVDMSSAKTATAYFYIPPVVTFNTFIAGTIAPAFGGAVARTTENYATSLPAGNFLMIHDPGTFTLTITANGCDTYTLNSVAVSEGLTTTVPAVNLTCSWDATLLGATEQLFPPSGGTGSVAVTIPSSLYWTAASNAAWITVTAPTGTANGNGTVSYSVSASTSSRTGTLTIAGKTFTVVQDATVPKVTGIAATSPTNSLNIPVTITATDNMAGTIKYLVTGSSTPPLAGDAGWTTTNPFSYTVATTGSHYLYGWAKDAAGNISSAVKPVRVIVDQNAPTTAANPTGGTYGPGLTVTLTTNETATIYYTTNGNTPTVSSSVYSGPVPISSTATLKYFAKDLAGNAEGVKSQAYVIDTVGPVGTIAMAGAITQTNSRTVSLVLSSADAVQMKFSNDGTTWTSPEVYGAAKSWTLAAGDGVKTIYVKFKDSVGNWSNAYTATVTLDTVPPVTSASLASGYYGSAQQATLSVNEEATIYYTTDGSTPTESSGVFTSPVPIAATTKLKFFAKDRAGNREAVKTVLYIQLASMGDVDKDVAIDVADAVLALKVLCGIAPAGSASDRGVVTLLGKVGLAEAIFILQKIAGLR